MAQYMKRINTDEENILLSICIPTYNRLIFLRESLDSILNQIEEINYKIVEIIISDNASSDGTKEYIDELIKNETNLKINYFRQLENLGPDVNILNTVNLARGEFIYIISDDDILLPGAISVLLSLIEKYPTHNAFCLNYKTFDTNPYMDKKTIHLVEEDLFIKNKDEVLIFFGTWITFLSSISFRRNTIEPDLYIDKIGTSLIQAYIYLEVLASNNGIYVTQKTYLAIRENNTGGYSFLKVFVSEFHELMLYAESIGYAKLTIEKVLAKHASEFLFGFIYGFKTNRIKGFNLNYLDGIRRVLKVYSSRFALINSSILIVILMAFPGFVLRALIKIAKTIKR
jgi:glycosyltransferase involved in cell wall biosynthesis